MGVPGTPHAKGKSRVEPRMSQRVMEGGPSDAAFAAFLFVVVVLNVIWGYACSISALFLVISSAVSYWFVYHFLSIRYAKTVEDVQKATVLVFFIRKVADSENNAITIVARRQGVFVSKYQLVCPRFDASYDYVAIAMKRSKRDPLQWYYWATAKDNSDKLCWLQLRGSFASSFSPPIEGSIGSIGIGYATVTNYGFWSFFIRAFIPRAAVALRKPSHWRDFRPVFCYFNGKDMTSLRPAGEYVWTLPKRLQYKTANAHTSRLPILDTTKVDWICTGATFDGHQDYYIGMPVVVQLAAEKPVALLGCVAEFSDREPAVAIGSESPPLSEYGSW